MKKKFIVVVDVAEPFDSSWLSIALNGMMVKVISAREVKMRKESKKPTAKKERSV